MTIQEDAMNPVGERIADAPEAGTDEGDLVRESVSKYQAELFTSALPPVAPADGVDAPGPRPSFGAELFTSVLPGDGLEPEAWPVEAGGLSGEVFSTLDRMIVAPVTGTFHPAAAGTVTAEGEVVSRGQVVGRITSLGSDVPVESRFTGFLMALLAAPGERVRQGQPLAWLRRTDA